MSDFDFCALWLHKKKIDELETLLRAMNEDPVKFILELGEGTYFIDLEYLQSQKKIINRIIKVVKMNDKEYELRLENKAGVMGEAHGVMGAPDNTSSQQEDE